MDKIYTGVDGANWHRGIPAVSWVGSVLSTQRGSALSARLQGKAGISQQAAGVLQIEPTRRASSNLVISCGIHGNETAPIEIVSELVEDILEDRLEVNARLLIIIGHPPAICAGQRFLHTNLNRLFGTKTPDYKATAGNYEQFRALELKNTLKRFFSGQRGTRYHFDLHTAIRPSEIEQFAISPFGQVLREPDLQLLGSTGVTAVLESHQPANTFSHYSANRLGALSFTLELGKVAKFGENDLSQLQLIDTSLRGLITGGSPISDAVPVRFKVVEELIRTSDDFELLVDDHTPNFTSFETDTLICRDRSTKYRTHHPDERIVFPNPNVPIGQRAGLMVVKN